MVKKLLQTRKRLLRKRTTFLRLFLKGMIIPILVIILLGVYLSGVIERNISMINATEMNRFATEFSTIARNQNKLTPLHMLDDNLLLSGAGMPLFDLTAWIEPKTQMVAFAYDQNGNIISSNRMCMTLEVVHKWEMESETTRKYYYYDPQEFDLPEFRKLFADAAENAQTNAYYYSMSVNSAWLNDTEKKMVPKDISVKVYKSNKRDNFSLLYILGIGRFRTAELIEEYQITTDIEPDGYVLTNKYVLGESPNTDPQYMEATIEGCDPAFFDKTAEEYRKQITDFMTREARLSYLGGYEQPMHKYIDARIEKIPENPNIAGIFTLIDTDAGVPQTWYRLNRVLGTLLGIMTLIVAVLSLIRNAKNKAQYAFEDYQRALTNNLAHDLKTPLSVIGGFAENLLMMRQNGDEKELEYLNAIMKNVSYTDEIIQKALQLSESTEIRKLQKTDCDLRQLADSLADKYRTSLTERGIVLKSEGSGSVSADADLLTATAENMISNAVKYTPDGGHIQITVSKKQLCITNDVAEDLDTKDLMMPFVKGDKARTDKHSSGLGLSIAKAAAEQNGFTLKISCRERVFKAILIF